VRKEKCNDLPEPQVGLSVKKSLSRLKKGNGDLIAKKEKKWRKRAIVVVGPPGSCSHRNVSTEEGILTRSQPLSKKVPRKKESAPERKNSCPKTHRAGLAEVRVSEGKG